MKHLYIKEWQGTGREHLAEWWLWREVMCRAVSDAASRRSKLRLEIARWIDTQDFETVCDFIGLVPEVLKKEIEDILQSAPSTAIAKSLLLKKYIIFDPEEQIEEEE